MRRRLRPFITFGSMVLFVLALAATGASFWRAPHWMHESSRTVQSEVAGSWDRRYEMHLWVFSRGGLHHSYRSVSVEGLPHEADGSPETSARFTWQSAPSYPWAGSGSRTWLGFAWNSAVDEEMVTLPAWPVLVLLGVMPLAWVVSRVRARLRTARQRRGLCAACGYDLRATRDRCPECGTSVTAAVVR
jgi:hypothetical protein